MTMLPNFCLHVLHLNTQTLPADLYNVDNTMAEGLSAKAQAHGMLHKTMMDLCFAQRYEESDEMAHKLLLNADLPLLIRARCHMVLSCGDSFPVEHGREAVRLLEEQDVICSAFPGVPTYTDISSIACGSGRR
jgi:hypothetical protein